MVSHNHVVWDLGGQTSIRPYWKCYYANTDGIVFVIDSADIDRLKAAKAELDSMLQVRKKGVDCLRLNFRKRSSRAFPCSSLPTSR